MAIKSFVSRFGFLVLYTGLLAVTEYLSDRSFASVGFVALGSLVGYVLPLFIDSWMPILQKTDRQNLPTAIQETMQRSVEVVKQEHVVAPKDQQSVFRSYIFLFAYAATALFVLTSTGSPFAEGVVLGLGLALIYDILTHRTPLSRLKERWFSVYQARLSDTELTYFVWGCVLMFAVLSVIGLFV